MAGVSFGNPVGVALEIKPMLFKVIESVFFGYS
jgi:hypothetical protein